MNLYVSNLGFSISESDLRSMFQFYGAVSSVKVILDRATGKSRGFGFVSFADEKSGREAINQLNGSVHDGRPIRVSEAKPREDRGSGGSRW